MLNKNINLSKMNKLYKELSNLYTLANRYNNNIKDFRDPLHPRRPGFGYIGNSLNDIKHISRNNIKQKDFDNLFNSLNNNINKIPNNLMDIKRAIKNRNGKVPKETRTKLTTLFKISNKCSRTLRHIHDRINN